MIIEPCPSCKSPPVIVEETGTSEFHIGCFQVFMRHKPGEPECVKKLAMMHAGTTRDAAARQWNRWVKSKTRPTTFNKDV